MSRPLRLFVALLLALAVPVQGAAAASMAIWMQAPAKVVVSDHADMGSGEHATHAMPADDGHEQGHCGPGEMPSGKCCQAHAYVVQSPSGAIRGEPQGFDPAPAVARWTNFIPEEPSPPPIRAFLFA